MRRRGEGEVRRRGEGEGRRRGRERGGGGRERGGGGGRGSNVLINESHGGVKVGLIENPALRFRTRPHQPEPAAAMYVRSIQTLHDRLLCVLAYYLIALSPRSCKSCMSSSTNDIMGSNLSVAGSQGGPFMTTFTPWKYLSLPKESTMRFVAVLTCRHATPSEAAAAVAKTLGVTTAIAASKCKLSAGVAIEFSEIERSRDTKVILILLYEFCISLVEFGWTAVPLEAPMGAVRTWEGICCC